MIGVFDSGLGGLSVWRELIKVLPEESYCYIADSGYCPYGPKSKEEIIDRAKKIVDFLIGRGASIIVVACNTATAAAIDYLREHYSIPFVGMEPAVKPAVLNSKSGVIGVLATKGTFKGELYLRTLHKFASGVKVIEQVGEGLVEVVEDGKMESDIAYTLLNRYLSPMIESGADNIVLGCTHYPFLINQINRITKGSINIINPAPAIAKRALSLCKSLEGLEHDNTLLFYTTGSSILLLKRMVEEINPLCLNSATFDTIVL